MFDIWNWLGDAKNDVYRRRLRFFSDSLRQKIEYEIYAFKIVGGSQ